MSLLALTLILLFFFFNDTATTEIYTLSLHDALPISRPRRWRRLGHDLGVHPSRQRASPHRDDWRRAVSSDRKSTRLNSSHGYISYAVFCLKKKKKKPQLLLNKQITHMSVHTRTSNVH